MDVEAIAKVLDVCPLPWCRADAAIARYFAGRRRRHFIQCRSCGLQTPQQETRAKAVRLWNEREAVRAYLEGEG